MATLDLFLDLYAICAEIPVLYICIQAFISPYYISVV